MEWVYPGRRDAPIKPRAPPSSAFLPGSQRGAISTLGQSSFYKVEPFLKLCELSRLTCQAGLGVVQRCGVLLQLVLQLGQRGSRGCAPAYCPGYCPRHQYRCASDHRESQ